MSFFAIPGSEPWRAAENGSTRDSSEAARNGGEVRRLFSFQTCVQASGTGTVSCTGSIWSIACFKESAAFSNKVNLCIALLFLKANE